MTPLEPFLFQINGRPQFRPDTVGLQRGETNPPNAGQHHVHDQHRRRHARVHRGRAVLRLARGVPALIFFFKPFSAAGAATFDQATPAAAQATRAKTQTTATGKDAAERGENDPPYNVERQHNGNGGDDQGNQRHGEKIIDLSFKQFDLIEGHPREFPVLLQQTFRGRHGRRIADDGGEKVHDEQDKIRPRHVQTHDVTQQLDVRDADSFQRGMQAFGIGPGPDPRSDHEKEKKHDGRTNADQQPFFAFLCATQLALSVGNQFHVPRPTTFAQNGLHVSLFVIATRQVHVCPGQVDHVTQFCGRGILVQLPTVQVG